MMTKGDREGGILLSHPHTKIIFFLNIKVPEDTEMRNIMITLL